MITVVPWRRAASRVALAIALIAAQLAPILPAAGASPSRLESFYHQKYPEWQQRMVRDAVALNFKHASARERVQACEETLAFFHVVFHATRWHHFQENIALARQHEGLIEDACRRFGVPLNMALSIFTWENGGHLNTTSFAACVGMGQMSMGAVAASHRYYHQAARALYAASVFCDLLATVASVTFQRDHGLEFVLRSTGHRMRMACDQLDLERRHGRMAKAAGVKDERVLARCNIEDSVVFMKLLLDAYGGRPDLAISAYHNGLANNDDLLRDYLKRVDPAAARFTATARGPLLDALRRHRISFLTLWNDTRCRQMLNGLRTMDGDVTTPGNAREALGDESDIYVWKTTGALAAYHASPWELSDLLARYRGNQDEAETAGFRAAGPMRHLADGIAVTPELAGYLRSVQDRVKRRTGRSFPLKLSAAHATHSHAAGIAVDLRFENPALAAILREDWLFDRIYRDRLPDGRVHVCLNPRFGSEFLGPVGREYALGP